MNDPIQDAVWQTLERFAEHCIEENLCEGLYVFGSLIYKNGEQFGNQSDIDIVANIGKINNAIDRHRVLMALKTKKIPIEVQLMQNLRRSAVEPIVSIVAVTPYEIDQDIHKDGHKEFFSSNTFRELNAEKKSVIGLCEKIPPIVADRYQSAVISFVQKIRNEFLSVSASTSTAFDGFFGEDPVPKRFMRAAAMAARAVGQTSGPGAEHDLREGLEFITHVLYQIRDSDRKYKNLHDNIAVRRRARGASSGVQAEELLLLSEVLYDAVGKVPQHGVQASDSASSEDAKGQAVAPPDDESDLGQAASSPTTSDDSEHGGKVEDRGDESVKSGRMPYGSSTVFFADRFAAAFPGLRSIKIFEDIREITERLMTLLHKPLIFTDGVPIWWWRGGNLHIEKFERLSEGRFLMNVDELKICKIAAVPSPSYRQSYVYVETEREEKTGLYSYSEGEIEKFTKKNGYVYEEYGLYKGDVLLNRNEYDDGGKYLDGILVDTRMHSELRVRYITPYNFLIAAQGSPINNPRFDKQLEGHLNECLGNSNHENLEKMQKAIFRLPMRPDPLES